MAASELEVIAEATNKFALDFHRCLANSDQYVNDNLFYSPTSHFIALAITGYGARGNTRAEIMKVLHVDSISSNDLNKGVRKLTDELNVVSSKNSKQTILSKRF